MGLTFPSRFANSMPVSKHASDAWLSHTESTPRDQRRNVILEYADSVPQFLAEILCRPAVRVWRQDRLLCDGLMAKRALALGVTSECRKVKGALLDPGI